MANEYSPTVTCAEEFGTAHEEYDDDRGLMSASVTLRCAYADRHSLASDILSNHRPWPKGSASITPTAYGAGIVMTGARSVVAPGAGSQRIDSLEALVTIHYSTKRVELITEEIEPTAEFKRLSPDLFRWFPSGDSLDEDEAPGLRQLGINFCRNELFVTPDQLSADLYNLVNCCNEASFESGLLPNFTAEAQTLLFNPPVIHMKYDSTGARTYDLTKRFSYNPNGWNKFFRASTGLWERISYAGTGIPFDNFPPSDFSAILVPQNPYT